MNLIAVFTTVESREQAQRIADALVLRGLVACAQISQIDSVFVWQGELQREPEFRLLLKTTAAQYAAVESAIRELHAYEIPAIFAVPVTHAFEPYAAWVAAGSEASKRREP